MFYKTESHEGGSTIQIKVVDVFHRSFLTPPTLIFDQLKILSANPPFSENYCFQRKKEFLQMSGCAGTKIRLKIVSGFCRYWSLAHSVDIFSPPPIKTLKIRAVVESRDC